MRKKIDCGRRRQRKEGLGVWLAAGVVVAVMWSYRAAAEEAEPVKTVRAFYKAIADKNCAEALGIRPGYKPGRCEAITKPDVKRLELKYHENGVAVCYLDIAYQDAGIPSFWTGYLQLIEQDGRWIITENYRSDVTLDEYLKQLVKPPPPKPETATTSSPTAGATTRGTTAGPPTPPASSPAPAETASAATPSGPVPSPGGGTPSPPDKRLNNSTLYYNYQAPEKTAPGEAATRATAEEKAPKGPEDVMVEYYQALNEQNVARACRLRLKCNEKIEKLVQTHNRIEIQSAVVKSEEQGRAVVVTESIETDQDGSRWRWKQDWYLVKEQEEWKIERTDNASYEQLP